MSGVSPGQIECIKATSTDHSRRYNPATLTVDGSNFSRVATPSLQTTWSIQNIILQKIIYSTLFFVLFFCNSITQSGIIWSGVRIMIIYSFFVFHVPKWHGLVPQPHFTIPASEHLPPPFVRPDRYDLPLIRHPPVSHLFESLHPCPLIE